MNPRQSELCNNAGHHVNAMRVDIEWSEDDLVALLEKRISKSEIFLNAIGLTSPSHGDVFRRIFPAQIDVGDRKPSAKNWIMSRIQDGKGVRPPRNLIDLTLKSWENQQRREHRESRGSYLSDRELIEADAVRLGLRQLSQIRVDDTLLAESGALAEHILKFRQEKSEHNIATICAILGMDEKEGLPAIRDLVEMEFLEELKGTYKVPMLYRDGLEIVQGKAF